MVVLKSGMWHGFTLHCCYSTDLFFNARMASRVLPVIGHHSPVQRPSSTDRSSTDRISSTRRNGEGSSLKTDLNFPWHFAWCTGRFRNLLQTEIRARTKLAKDTATSVCRGWVCTVLKLISGSTHSTDLRGLTRRPIKM